MARSWTATSVAGTGQRGCPVLLQNLTGYEIDALDRSYNLTDGHAFRRWSAAEEAVINESSRLFKNYAGTLLAEVCRRVSDSVAV
jgi:hypothetical protein